jgi:hypothetical protein
MAWKIRKQIRTAPGTFRWLVMAVGVLLVLSGCATRFEKYDMGDLTLLIGPQGAVQHECESRGTAHYSSQDKIFGCTDFATRTILSVPHMAVISHELCHWFKQTPSHDTCPTPLYPSEARSLDRHLASGSGE